MTTSRAEPGESGTALRDQLARRAEQFRAFERWEAAQRRAAGPPDATEIRRNLAWLDDAYAFACRMGSAGPGASEQHLRDLVAWVERWRHAWRADA